MLTTPLVWVGGGVLGGGGDQEDMEGGKERERERERERIGEEKVRRHTFFVYRMSEKKEREEGG